MKNASAWEWLAIAPTRSDDPQFRSADPLGSDQGKSRFTLRSRRGTPGRMSENITHTPSTKRLERSSEDRVIAGVSGGLGRYFDLNPTFFRLICGPHAAGRRRDSDLPRRSSRRPRRGQAVDRGRLSPHDASGRCRSWDSASPLLRWRPSRAALAPQPASAGYSFCSRVSQSSDLRRAPRRRRSRIIVRSLVGVTVALIVAVVAAVSVAFAWFDVGLGDGSALGSSPRNRC
jgi:hypothetical protein